MLNAAWHELRGRWRVLLTPLLCSAWWVADAARGGDGTVPRLLFALVAAPLVATRVGGAEDRLANPEGSEPASGDRARGSPAAGSAGLGRRLAEVTVQVVAVGAPALFLGVGTKGHTEPVRIEGAVLQVLVFGGVAMLMWSSTAAATRFTRRLLVIIGPVAALGALALLLAAHRDEAALGAMFGLTLASTLVALLPRPPARSEPRPC